MAAATEMIFADIRAGGPWSRRIVAAKTPAESRIGQTSFDGQARKPTFSERLRRLKPLPTCVVIDWVDEESLYVFAIGLPEGAPNFAEQVSVTERDISKAAERLVALVSDAFNFLDSKKTEAIKIYEMPNEVKHLMPWIRDSPQGKRLDPWNV